MKLGTKVYIEYKFDYQNQFKKIIIKLCLFLNKETVFLD